MSTKPRTSNRKPRAASCSQRKIQKVLREYKTGALRYAKGKEHPEGLPVKNRRQALAIALSESRRVCGSKNKKKKKKAAAVRRSVKK